MVFGYVIDILMFHQIPTKLTMLGAAMMLLAVMTIALTRLPKTRTKEPTASVASPTSLASFVASEFAEYQEELVEEQPPNVSGPRQRVPFALPVNLIGARA
eukprot:CAMPEP_0114642112 /NCGR_PEP_ID=MMETSP0191-20121206/2645_1 /TAXON_ID=126664 /ORGANISM="Sorites sp." /LENGTH=100 /DNA_ID=CAMNT_0001854255 /DNA_START=243 /DNA_END=545 /DNA_ORIENTATION=+